MTAFSMPRILAAAALVACIATGAVSHAEASGKNADAGPIVTKVEIIARDQRATGSTVRHHHAGGGTVQCIKAPCPQVRDHHASRHPKRHHRFGRSKIYCVKAPCPQPRGRHTSGTMRDHLSVAGKVYCARRYCSRAGKRGQGALSGKVVR